MFIKYYSATSKCKQHLSLPRDTSSSSSSNLYYISTSTPTHCISTVPAKSFRRPICASFGKTKTTPTHLPNFTCLPVKHVSRHHTLSTPPHEGVKKLPLFSNKCGSLPYPAVAIPARTRPAKVAIVRTAPKLCFIIPVCFRHQFGPTSAASLLTIPSRMHLLVAFLR